MAMVVQWMNKPDLLETLAMVSLREAFDKEEYRLRVQFLCALIRVSSLEAMQQYADPLRVKWAKVMK